MRFKLSFDDEKSFKEASGSLPFNNPPCDPNSLRRVGSSSVPPEDNCFNNNPPNDPDPNIILQVRRVPVGN